MKSKTVLFGQPVNSSEVANVLEPVILLGALLVIYWPLMSPSQVIGGMDFQNLVFPQVAYAATVLRSGFIPLWNWYTWGGSPLLAAWQSAILYPPTWCAIFIGVPFGLQIIILLHLWIAALGVSRLTRTLFPVSRRGTVLTGLCYAGSGFFLGHIEQVNSVAAIAWTPWVVDAFVSLLCFRKGLRQLIVCTSLSLLSGHPQHIQLALLLTGGGLCFCYVLLFLGGNPPVSAKETIGRCLLAAGSFVASLAIVSGQVIPALELASFSERIWPYSDPFTPHFRWSHIPAFVVPRFFNHLAGTEGQPVGYTEESVYVGIASFALAAYGVAWLATQRKFFTALILTFFCFMLSMLFALGPEGGVAPLLVNTFPGLAKMRGAARALNLSVMVVSIWAGSGYSRLLRKLSGPWRTTVAIVIPLVVVADFSLTHRPELLSLLTPAAAMRNLNTTVEDIRPTCDSPQRVYRFMAYDADLYLDHRSSAVAERYVRIQPNLNMLYGVAVSDGYEEGLLPPWPYGNFLRHFNRNLRNESLDRALLALMGVQFVLTEYPATFDSTMWEKISETPPRSWTGTKYSLWRNRIPTAWFWDPQILFATRTGKQPDIIKIVQAYFTPHRKNTSTLPPRAETRRDIQSHPAISLNEQDFARASVESKLCVARVLPNGLHIKLRSDPPFTVLFSGPLCPGWKWISSDRRMEDAVLSGNFRPFVLVKIPRFSGGHNRGTCRLVYYPFSYRVGVFVSLLTLAVLTVIWCRRRPEPAFHS
ncbi:MAG: hypothetical protein N2Z21_04295 [Candidatus Sumerlaeaceae bacterium]|nr:hypothetical protein [Candidatus Sumerlaeaceae bacterium]